MSLYCRTGPRTVLTTEEEARLAQYYVEMADVGFGLTREGVMAMVYAIVEKDWPRPPFQRRKCWQGVV